MAGRTRGESRTPSRSPPTNRSPAGPRPSPTHDFVPRSWTASPSAPTSSRPAAIPTDSPTPALNAPPSDRPTQIAPTILEWRAERNPCTRSQAGTVKRVFPLISEVAGRIVAATLVILQYGEKVRVPGDPGPTARTRRQAESAAAAVAPLRPVSLVSSPLLRACQTAEPLAKLCGLPIQVDQRLAERMNLLVRYRALREGVASNHSRSFVGACGRTFLRWRAAGVQACVGASARDTLFPSGSMIVTCRTPLS